MKTCVSRKSSNVIKPRLESRLTMRIVRRGRIKIGYSGWSRILLIVSAKSSKTKKIGESNSGRNG